MGKGAQAGLYGWAGAAGTLGFVDIRTRRSFMTALVLRRWGWVYMRKAL